MKSKPDEKVVDHPGDGPAATILRLVPRAERDERRQSAIARHDVPRRRVEPPARDDDDDPGPTAA
ncbi:MAG: hypothetical protein IRY94_15525 [Rhodospirillaceae bacterium]|nr:hypothetical protein [Rhodospirillaceae bacterium]